MERKHGIEHQPCFLAADRMPCYQNIFLFLVLLLWIRVEIQNVQNQTNCQRYCDSSTHHYLYALSFLLL